MDFVHVLTKPDGSIYRGGQFGFVSSHAANSFAIAWFVGRILKSKKAWTLMVSWALVVSYSRIYLGVHYPGDILGGALIGIGSGSIAAFVYHKLQLKWTH
jgi:undecaprenyl-diphosphatase